jgi:hypothetical protein
VCHAAQHDVVLEFRFGGQPHLRIALEQAVKGDLPLRPRQRRTEAVVVAASERDVLARVAAEVEPARCLEDGRVVVGRAEQQDHLLAGRNLPSPDLDVLDGGAAIGLHGAVVAQHLLDGVLHQLRIVAQPLKLVRMAQQRQQAVADQVRRGLIAGDQQ